MRAGVRAESVQVFLVVSNAGRLSRSWWAANSVNGGALEGDRRVTHKPTSGSPTACHVDTADTSPARHDSATFLAN